MFHIVSLWSEALAAASNLEHLEVTPDDITWRGHMMSPVTICYVSLHVIQAQIDLRFCVAGQQNGAREAVGSSYFVTLEEC